MPPRRGPSVLHVAHHVLPHLGGIETVVGAETAGLRERGWSVSVVTTADTVGPGTREEDGARVVRVRAWDGLEARFGVPFPFFSPRLLVTLAREVRRADVVHVHDVLYLSSWVAALWCRLLRTPYVVHRHVGFVHHSSALVRAVQAVVIGTAGRLVLAGAAAVLAIDEQIAAGLRATVRDPAKVEVLGNGVDTDRFRPRSRPERATPVALFVGRFVPKKGFDLVAAAASDDYEIAFAGGDRPAGVDDPRLRFLGAVPAAAMPQVYAEADVMVVASVGECPLTVLEAMASGLPVLLREDPALHSVWTDGPWPGEPGVEFVDMAAGDLAGALGRLAADPGLRGRMGAAGAERAHPAYSWATHVDRLTEIYRGVTTRPLPR